MASFPLVQTLLLLATCSLLLAAAEAGRLAPGDDSVVLISEEVKSGAATNLWSWPGCFKPPRPAQAPRTVPPNGPPHHLGDDSVVIISDDVQSGTAADLYGHGPGCARPTHPPFAVPPNAAPSHLGDGTVVEAINEGLHKKHSPPPAEAPTAVPPNAAP